ncbi:HTH-type transcriptional regulator NsrR [Mesorhizobium sp. L-8-10]|uniref:RrF2 family transcriptional regulator n=1 Tax=Mesorhizobium sp. L-8-10 TaxID=2744523 RepID=UPI001936CAEC|nr:Rrf2 family transcriptional regulator [Mesorhizobium sp. L-8-10]BCH32785.1 HTH-type transcriptional regulator NsrR [Mesorhizobium sp. L-8-10]
MTFHTDYTLRMLIYLAMRPGRVSTVGDVAEAYQLSRNHLLKVALKLRKLGLIATVRGRAGGIRIAKLPAEISIGALVRATEEEFALVECLQGDGGCCAISPACRLKGMFGEALSAYLAVLDRYTLADVVRNRTALETLLGVDTHAA